MYMLYNYCHRATAHLQSNILLLLLLLPTSHAIYNFTRIKVYKRPDDGSQLQPKL